MTPQERLLAALQYQRPSLGDVVPVAGVDNAPTAGPMSFMERLREGSAGAGRGLESQLEGYKQMAVHPIDSARAMGQGVVDIAKNPSKIVDALKAMGEKGMSSPAGLGEVLGENLSLNPRKLIEALSRPNVREMTVYHGTGHTLPPVEGAPLGRFDASKIGTGEGNQSYGHGIYVAESPEVAKQYKLANETTQTHVNGVHLESSDPMYEAAVKVNLYGYDNALKDVQKNASNEFLTPAGRQSQLALAEKIKSLQNAKVEAKKTGSLYTVDLPDEKIAKMISWDAPLGEQPEAKSAIRKLLLSDAVEQRALDDFGVKTKKQLADMLLQDDAHIQSVYGSLSDVFRTDKGASEALKSAGIPGIRYLDEKSRGSKNKTQNFVVFPGEEQNLKILERK